MDFCWGWVLYGWVFDKFQTDVATDWVADVADVATDVATDWVADVTDVATDWVADVTDGLLVGC